MGAQPKGEVPCAYLHTGVKPGMRGIHVRPSENEAGQHTCIPGSNPACGGSTSGPVKTKPVVET
jgi:hypothetical protein